MATNSNSLEFVGKTKRLPCPRKAPFAVLNCTSEKASLFMDRSTFLLLAGILYIVNPLIDVNRRILLAQAKKVML